MAAGADRLQNGLTRRLGLHSIQGRLTAIAFCFIVGTSAAVGVAGYRLTVNFESARFREHFTLLASYLAKNAELGVLLANPRILEGLAENMLAMSDVRAVEIRDRRGEKIISKAHPGGAEGLESVSVPVVADPMARGDSPFFGPAEEVEEVLGQVRLYYADTGLNELRKLLAARFLLISLLLGSVPVVMYWLLARAINAPLRELLAVAVQVSRGRMEVRASGGALRETATLAHAFNEMLDALARERRKLDEAHAAMARQQVLAEVGKFSMIVAHEIKNPLAIIKGSLDVLRKDAPLAPGMKERLLGFLDEEIARINKLIEDFLVFARPQPPAFRPVALDGLVAGLYRRIRLLGPGIGIESDDCAGAELACDPQLLERALLNIVRNALDLAASEAGVRVRVERRPGELLFVVEDDGPGIAAENLPRIFEPFFSTRAKGTGLGLAIASEIISGHGGGIAAENREKGGARFTVRIPLEEKRVPSAED